MKSLRNSVDAVSAVWWAIGAVILDRLVTLPLWGYEANPVVAEMGQTTWLLVSAVLVVGLLVAWYPFNARSSKIGHVLVYGVTGLHLLVVVSNLAVVTL
jgi:hypothetical protein